MKNSSIDWEGLLNPLLPKELLAVNDCLGRECGFSLGMWPLVTSSMPMCLQVALTGLSWLNK